MSPQISLSWLSALHLVGAAQGLLLAVALARARRNRVASALLALAMFAFSVYLLSAVHMASGYYQSTPHLFGISYPLPFLFGAAIYLYAKASTQGPASLSGRDLLFFAPFLATVALALPIYLRPGGDKIALYESLLRGEEPGYFALIDSLKIAYGVACTALSLRLLYRHGRHIKDVYSDVERVDLRSLRLVVLAGTAIWTLALVLQLVQLSGFDPVEQFDDIISLALAVFVYAMGYVALRQPEIVIPAATGAARDEDEDEDEEGPRYERSGLSPEEATSLRERLVRVMEEEKPYLKADLTLSELAARVSATPHNLSEIINTEFRQNFYDFVNGHRVEEVKARLQDPRHRGGSVLSLALNCGFNSKSSFNAAFKKRVGLTPSQFRDAARPA